MISDVDLLIVLEDTFSRGQSVSFTPTGSSMLPMLDGTTDTVVLSQKPSALRKYDVVLYRRKSDNALMLHRIVKVIGDSLYCMSGDNQYYFDTDVHYDDIFAVVTSFTHHGKHYDSTSLIYHCYIYIILTKKKIRLFLSKIYHMIFK